MSNSNDLQVSYQYKAPAKINWDLYVLPRDSSGLHPIDSLVSTVSVYDDLVIHLRQGHGINVECDVSPGRDNIVWKAIKAFLDFTKQSYYVSVEICKNIPHGAGFGGGSSDAMSTLKALDKATGSNLSTNEMLNLASQIGSDLPLFFFGGWVWVTGTGEVVQRIDIPRKTLLLVKSKASISTKLVYQQWDEYEHLKEIPDIKTRIANPYNALQYTTSQIEPEMDRIVRYLKRMPFTRNVTMTGSGTALFTEIDEDYSIQPEEIERECGCKCWLTQTTNS